MLSKSSGAPLVVFFGVSDSLLSVSERDRVVDQSFARRR
jgi:hypothetical protein